MSSYQLHRKLKPRHVAMIAIAGSVGSGLFIASGTAVYEGGPGGALLAYALVGVMVYFLMTSLGEMSTLIPTTGSFCDFATRFVDPAFGFAMSYNYWISWTVITAVDLSAAGLIMHTWVPQISFMAWVALFFSAIFILNLVSVGFYGELEYWFAILKILTILVFILVGILLIIGLIGPKEPIDFTNWNIGDAPFHAGWIGFFHALMIAGFSFQGSEVFGLTAGEMKEPVLSIPRAVRRVFWRIFLFYIVSITVIGFLIPYNNPLLIHASTTNIGSSPFTLIFQSAGFHGVQNAMTLVVLLAILISANSTLFMGTRTLWHIAQEGNAPRFFSYTTRFGSPIVALCASATISGVVFLSSIFGVGRIFIWLLNLSSLAGFIIWFGIALCHYRFRRAYLHQGKHLEDLPYYAWGFPLGPLLSMAFCILIVLVQHLSVGAHLTLNIDSTIGTYIGIPIFLIFYLGYKVYKRTRLVPLSECRFDFKK